MSNSVIAAFSDQAPKNVLNAIGAAADKTGVDFAYLVQQAKAESSFNPAAKAKTSSATGLFQFIDSTWMQMVDRYGDKHGIETDGKSKSEILSLRKDAAVSSNMAAEFASENERFLQSHWAKGEKEIGATELYFAHFMGAGGGAAFLNARDENPLGAAADVFPRAAKANRNVFYDSKTGAPRSFEQVYAFFDKKFSIKSDDFVPKTPGVESVIYKKKDEGADSSVFLTGSLFQSEHNDRNGLFQKTDVQPTRHDMMGVRAAVASPLHQGLVQSPIDIMLLSQLDLPTRQDIQRHK